MKSHIELFIETLEQTKNIACITSLEFGFNIFKSQSAEKQKLIANAMQESKTLNPLYEEYMSFLNSNSSVSLNQEVLYLYPLWQAFIPYLENKGYHQQDCIYFSQKLGYVYFSKEDFEFSLEEDTIAIYDELENDSFIEPFQNNAVFPILSKK